MSKTLHRLKVLQVQSAPPGALLNDGGGLFYRATAKGAGRWVFRFTSPDPAYLAAQAAKGSKTRQREMGLGSFPGTTLALAREKASAARDAVSRGLDPIAEGEREAEAARQKAEADAKALAENTMTFGRYADEIFLPKVLPNFRTDTTKQKWETTFATHAKSLRGEPLASITREDVLDVLKPIWTVKQETAARCRQRIEKLFNHAAQNGYFHHDNPAAWGLFDHTLPKPTYKRNPRHHPSVPQDEIAAFIAAVRAKQPKSLSALMLDWITLSACRTIDARFGVWSEIDLKRKIWSISATRMKMQRDHAVPITARMEEILAEAKRRRTNPAGPEDYIFCGPDGEPLSEAAALELIHDLKDFGRYTVHGLRATFKGWAKTCTEFPRELIEEQLAHQLEETERAYDRVAAVERRRRMMEEWAALCAGESLAVRAVNVVPLRAVNGGQG